MNIKHVPVNTRGRGRGLPLAKMPPTQGNARQAIAVARPARPAISHPKGILPKPPAPKPPTPKTPTANSPIKLITPMSVVKPFPKIVRQHPLPPSALGTPPRVPDIPTPTYKSAVPLQLQPQLLPQQQPQPQPQPTQSPRKTPTAVTESRDLYKFERRLVELNPALRKGIPGNVIRVLANHVRIPAEANLLQFDEGSNPPEIICSQDSDLPIDVDDLSDTTGGKLQTVSVLLMSVDVIAHSHSIKLYLNKDNQIPTFTGETSNDLAVALKENTNGGLDLTEIYTWFPFVQLRNKENIQSTVFIPMLIESSKVLKAVGFKAVPLSEALDSSDFLVRLVADSMTEFVTRQCTEIIWNQLEKNVSLLEVVNQRKKAKAEKEKTKRSLREEARADLKRLRQEEKIEWEAKCAEENVGLTEDDVSELTPGRTVFIANFKQETAKLEKQLQETWQIEDDNEITSTGQNTKITSSQPDMKYKRALGHFCGTSKGCVQRNHYARALLSLSPVNGDLQRLTELLQLIPTKGSIYNMHQISEQECNLYQKQPNEATEEEEEEEMVVEDPTDCNEPTPCELSGEEAQVES